MSDNDSCPDLIWSLFVSKILHFLDLHLWNSHLPFATTVIWLHDIFMSCKLCLLHSDCHFYHYYYFSGSISLFNLYWQEERYMVTYNPSKGNVYALLKDEAKSDDILKAAFHVSFSSFEHKLLYAISVCLILFIYFWYYRLMCFCILSVHQMWTSLQENTLVTQNPYTTVQCLQP